MKYLLIMHVNPAVMDGLTEEQRTTIMEGHGKFIETIRESGELIVTQALADPANSSVVRVRDGVPVISDGPYLEAKEYLGGYYLVDCEGVERAQELAAMIPDAAFEGFGVEVRPVMFSDRPGDVALAGRSPCRGPAARAGAAGPRRARAPPRPVRRCEDAVQEALLAAAVQWPDEGVPEQPARLADHGRHPAVDRPVAQRERAAPPRGDARGHGRASRSRAGPEATGQDQDDTLTLLFLCCHPALSAPSQLALTLRAVGGLTTAEIARAFLVPEATMAQRISRAKQQIKAAGAMFAHAGGRRACRAAAASSCRCST